VSGRSRTPNISITVYVVGDSALNEVIASFLYIVSNLLFVIIQSFEAK
jgi:hypothetical protein